MSGVSPLEHEWGEHTLERYMEAVWACKKTVRLSREAYSRFRKLLWYDMRKYSKAGRGRVLRDDVPELGLEKGDKLDKKITLSDKKETLIKVVNKDKQKSLDTPEKEKAIRKRLLNIKNTLGAPGVMKVVANRIAVFMDRLSVNEKTPV